MKVPKITTCRAALFLFSTLILFGCSEDGDESAGGRDYRQDMRDFVQGISDYGKSLDPDFIIIPQNGHELLTEDGEENGSPASEYIQAIDGVGREDLFYGYNEDNQSTPPSEIAYMTAFMDVAKNNGVEALVTDYCWTHSFMDDSYQQNNERGYISFAADHRELDNIPDHPAAPYNVNSNDISSLSEAKNFLYLLNYELFTDKDQLLSELQETNYDLLIIDLFYNGTELTPGEVASLKSKLDGGERLVVSYMSIGEAEDYRYYWMPDWTVGSPPWIAAENPNWEGNYKVRYWDPEWQGIIYGNNDSYVTKIIDTGFDGVYLDIIDAFEYFETE